MSRVLLVSPAFHGYWRSLASALARRGHRVDTWLYDLNAGPRAKVRHQLAHELPARLPGRLGTDRTESLAQRMTRRAAAAVGEHRPDVVVAVKADHLRHGFWDAVDRAGSARVTWLYDELRRMRWDAECLRRAGSIATYSPLDAVALAARGLDAHHLPLAFDPHLCPDSPAAPSGEVVFVGARYPRREADLVALHDAGVPVRAFGRDWSRHAVDRARTWGWSRPPVPAGRDLDRCAAYAVQAAADAVLNVHGDQDGFTMRTFEVGGVGGVQLCDRPDVAVHYEVGREVLVFDSTDELVDLARRARADRPWADRLRAAARERTLAEHTFDHRVAVLESLWA